MPGSTESQERRWIVLTHHLPPEPAYLRVKVRRRLEGMGAIPVKSSVYALPASDDAVEDLQWLANEIVKEGGDVFLANATFIDGATDERLVARSREARELEYHELVSEARASGVEADSTPDRGSPANARRLAERLAAIERIDFFHANGRDEAERAIGELMSPSIQTQDTTKRGPEWSGRTWVTRKGPKIDRISSAWLIQRFIDSDATFEFVEPDHYTHAPAHLRFDMFEGEFTHEGEACTFETLIARFGLEDTALSALAEIVHDLDCKDDKFGRAETAGVAAIIDGIARGEADDHARLKRGGVFLDALYEHFRSRRA
jgi:hypothetical protein